MLTTRPFQPSDRLTLLEHLGDPSIASALPDFHNHPIDLWLDSILTDPHSYAITLDDLMIGACRLEQNPHSDFSYWLHPDHRGKGYATQINGKLCRMAISLGWKTISGTCDPSNIPSQTVLIRCGFQQTSPTIWTKSL